MNLMMDRGCCGEERAQYKSKAAALSVNQHSYPYPCIRVLGTDLRNDTRYKKLLYTQSVVGLSLGDRVKSLVIRKGFRAKPLLLHIERSQLR